MASPSATSVTRRRQRSTRVTVAVVLVALAAFAVVGAVVSGSWLVASVAALLALVLGAGATKITHSELMATRVEAARDRAQQAQAYRALTEARVAEQAKHDAHMTREISRREEAISDLEAALTAAHQRAADAVRARADEARRADQAERAGQSVAVRLEEAEQRAAEAIVRVHELESELDAVRAELDAVRSQDWNKTRSA
ncbi:hypothetical protein [Nocardioides sp. CER19]|uniref:hypothetical protein n=1 Tax=Nocardioides sp. CER19 TaxID=3038538 RepID=UPI00244C1688|nr:hypothetical protein [Nocardioides sp. CER19]MDH2414215.1 hypothetical protein [Nocardioides sp. CER19]